VALGRCSEGLPNGFLSASGRWLRGPESVRGRSPKWLRVAQVGGFVALSRCAESLLHGSCIVSRMSPVGGFVAMGR